MRSGVGVEVFLTPFRGGSAISAFALSEVTFVGVLSVSIVESFLRCCGVGVSGVNGGLSFEACGVTRSPFVPPSRTRFRFAGVLAVDDAATRSSEERFVCEKCGDVIM